MASKTYADPMSPLAQVDPTTTLFPDTATVAPNSSPAVASGSVKLRSRLPAVSKMWTDPAPALSETAHITTVFPEMAVE